MQTGQEINEVDQSGFSTQGSTVFAGNLGANRYIVQITQMGVRLLQGIEQVRILALKYSLLFSQFQTIFTYIIDI